MDRSRNRSLLTRLPPLTAHFISSANTLVLGGLGADARRGLVLRDVTSVSARPSPSRKKKIFLIFYLCIPTACSSAWLIVYSGIFVEYVNSDMWQRKAPTDIQDRDVITAKYFAVLLPSHKMLRLF